MNKLNIKSQGFSLIEAMVSLALGLFLVSFGLHAIITTNEQFSYLKQVSRVQETARFTYELLQRDVQQSRDWRRMLRFAHITGSSTIETNPNLGCNDTNTQWARQIRQPVYAKNNSANQYQCVHNDDYLQGDILTLRGLLPDATLNWDDQQFYLRHLAVKFRFFKGVDRNLMQNSFLSNSKTQQLFAHSYFVGDTQRSCSNQVIPALFWQTIVNGLPVKQELLAGVEHLQVEFGIDNNADGIIDQYSVAKDSLNWQDIKSINVTILVRSICPIFNYKNDKSYQIGDLNYPVNDSFYRQKFEFSFHY